MSTPRSSRFFENKDCQYYPCHKDIEEINCLFCFCPWYWDCGSKEGLSNCMECTFPHNPDSYDLLMKGIENIYKKNEPK